MRIHGRGPQPKQKIEFVDDWSRLMDSVGVLKLALEQRGEDGRFTINADVAQDIVHFVPMLRDAYAECFELSLQMTEAWESLQASKDSLYVPSAAEMVAGVANPERTRR